METASIQRVSRRREWRLIDPGFHVAIFLVLTVFTACKESGDIDHKHAATEQYTCPMHPQVIQDQPGNCPVCGMDLVKVKIAGTSDAELMLTDSQIKLANITTQTVTRQPVGQTLVINARVAVDEQKSQIISSRAAGRVEKLFIRETGQIIKQGQPLYILYSEELLTLQQEYLLAREQYEALGETEARYKSFMEASERKLLLYGLTKNQIRDLTDRKSLQPRLTFLAPSGGVVTEVNATEGQYIGEGGVLYKTEDISSLWVEAELYPNETPLVKIGDRVNVRLIGTDSIAVRARIIFLSPEYRNNSQITIMRASISNPDGVFKPGQFAQVHLTHSSREALAIPADAVIRDAHGTHVYLQSGNNSFRPQRVKTGIENFDLVEITEGIREGDTVAVTGAYLLYSEIILRKGTNPMAGQHH